MNFKRLFHTVVFLQYKQIFYQIKYRLLKPKYKRYDNEVKESQLKLVDAIAKNKCLGSDSFEFINLSSKFASWNDASNGMLWAYNLNYMDYLLQEDMTLDEGAKWIDKFIEDLPTNKVGLDPYPIALRGINWIKFISKYSSKIPSERLESWNNSLYSQYKLLEKKLEYHLLGNHLLEDAYSLFIASIYFSDERMYSKSSKLLINELKEQILADGAHYEQSPMYHCILLDRLLDCCNVSFNNPRFEEQLSMNAFLREKASQMLGHLSAVAYNDLSFPLLNDSANGIAPTPRELFDYATRLSIEWGEMPMRECGCRKLCNEHIESIIDIGNITASYQPGHTHADTFNYELRIDGMPFIVDTGISTYNKTERRQYERSTKAHNTVSVDGKDSTEVWGGFRVAKRATVSVEQDESTKVKACHDGFGKGKLHHRSFEISSQSFMIKDTVANVQNAVSYIHFAPEVKIDKFENSYIETSMAKVFIEGAEKVEIVDDTISLEYNEFQSIKVAKISFVEEMSYTVCLR